MSYLFSERDIRILRDIYRYGYPSSRLVKKWHLADLKPHGAREALRRMNAKGKYIERQAMNKRTGEVKCDILFLNRKGANYIEHHYGRAEYDLGFRPKQELKDILRYHHREKVIDVWRKLETENEALNLLCEVVTEHHFRRNLSGKLKSHTMLEMRNGKAEDNVHADLLCVVAKAGEAQKQNFFCVEVDMGTETIGGAKIFIDPDSAKSNSLLSKYRRYERLLPNGGWKDNVQTTANSYKVLTITTTQQRIESIQRICSPYLQWHQVFLFSTFEDIEQNGIFGECWQAITPNAPKQRITQTLKQQ